MNNNLVKSHNVIHKELNVSELIEENKRLKQERKDLVVAVNNKMINAKSDHKITTGDHKWYLTGQYDAFDYLMEKLK